MSRGHFYLDKSNAKISGVCAGIADYTDVDALWIRIAAVMLLIFVSPIVIPVYIAIAVMADKRPLGLYSEDEELRLLRRMRRRRDRKGLNFGPALRSSALRNDLSDMDRRIAEMEAHYSHSSSRLAAEIDQLR
ncbi:PspC domain-containing protein [Novosphingobium sp. Leaf2]|uniref:PspC domain-containing protein n=1 Tax=Novosphingobium sp. Leaf2 TaxID=1735670 RepID=UPI0006F50BB9|nr:PspC domain-containing protein [Novosphingobium sp. Leaf2]KQM22252.1 phage shock protein C [Novosphingobium sp. Leaf2]